MGLIAVELTLDLDTFFMLSENGLEPIDVADFGEVGSKALSVDDTEPNSSLSLLFCVAVVVGEVAVPAVMFCDKDTNLTGLSRGLESWNGDRM